MTTHPAKAAGFVLLMWLLATITLGLQSWTGGQTIYAQELEAVREVAHFSILANEAPGGAGWKAVGGLTVQKRIGVIYLAEAIRQHTTLSIGDVYKLIDSFFLFASLLSIFFFLRRWLSEIYSLLGVVYFSAMLPMTYLFHVFHPWDRLQLAIWIGLLCLVADRRFSLLAAGLFVSVLVKFDTVMLPFFYLAVHFRKSHWKEVLIESAALFFLAAGTYIALGRLFPAPMDVDVGFNWMSALSQLEKNVLTAVKMNFHFPPLLVHALPTFLSLFFLKLKDRFVSSSVFFSFGLSVVFILFSNYEEVRAHMIVLILVLPSALLTLERILNYNTLETRSP